MKNIYQSLLLLIAGSTEQELARHVRYLKVENEILRSKLGKRVYISPSAYHPNEDWVVEQAEQFLDHAKQQNLEVKTLMHDRDTKFTASFDAIFNDSNRETKEASFRSPNTNCHLERYIQTLQQEVLDYFVVFGPEHMDHIVSEAVEYYHQERPHQAKDNEVLIKQPADIPSDAVEDDKSMRIECRERLGGLLKHYCHKAA